MFKKINHVPDSNKGQFFAIAVAFALMVGYLSVLVVPQKAAAYTVCTGSSCSASIEECLARNPRPLLKIGGVPDKRCTGAVQGFMKEVFGRNIAIDGIYGNQTALTVAWLQGQFRLTMDGKVGTNTWNVISDICAWIYAANENQACFSTYPI